MPRTSAPFLGFFPLRTQLLPETRPLEGRASSVLLLSRAEGSARSAGGDDDGDDGDDYDPDFKAPPPDLSLLVSPAPRESCALAALDEVRRKRAAEARDKRLARSDGVGQSKHGFDLAYAHATVFHIVPRMASAAASQREHERRVAAERQLEAERAARRRIAAELAREREARGRAVLEWSKRPWGLSPMMHSPSANFCFLLFFRRATPSIFAFFLAE